MKEQWQKDSEYINKYVDQLVGMLRDDADASPVAYMAVDMVYRPFMHWLGAAQDLKINATATRNSAIHLVNMMVLEILARMDVGDDFQGTVDWVEDFIEILMRELDEDLRALRKRRMANDNAKKS